MQITQGLHKAIYTRNEKNREMNATFVIERQNHIHELWSEKVLHFQFHANHAKTWNGDLRKKRKNPAINRCIRESKCGCRDNITLTNSAAVKQKTRIRPLHANHAKTSNYDLHETRNATFAINFRPSNIINLDR